MRAVTWRFLDPLRDVGLLVLRVGLGLAFIAHGWPKLVGGPERWEGVGSSMAYLGIHFGHTAWGLAAAVAEVVGGALLALGLATRPSALVLLFTMFVAVVRHAAAGEGFMGYSHALEDGIAFAALVLMGAGRYSLDARLDPPSDDPAAAR